MERDYNDYFGVPPKLLCKYVSSERIDVLENQRIRFTPMLETNDRFEIRQTFEAAIGPKADQWIARTFAAADVGKIAKLVAAQTGRDAASVDLEQVRLLAIRIMKENIVPAANNQQNIEAILMKIGGRSCALSLSDDPFNPSMWDRYAEQWKGFVLYFDTASPFFWCDEQGREIKPEKVRYSDAMEDELITNFRAPLLTKFPHWSNEREWRLIIDADNFAPSDDAEEQKAANLRLRKIPPTAIAKVLLGPDSSDDLAARCKALQATNLPHLEVCRARLDQFKGKVGEEPV